MFEMCYLGSTEWGLLLSFREKSVFELQQTWMPWQQTLKEIISVLYFLVCYQFWFFPSVLYFHYFFYSFGFNESFLMIKVYPIIFLVITLYFHVFRGDVRSCHIKLSVVKNILHCLVKLTSETSCWEIST